MEIFFTPEILEYISDLSALSEKARIQRYAVRQKEMGRVIREPVSKPLGNGIYEMRPGPHRLLFFVYREKIIVIHAFRKKTQKTPQNELLSAMRKREDWLRHEQSL